LNKTVQYTVSLTGSTNVPVRADVPLKVPDKHAFRLRYVQFRLQSVHNADRDYFMGLSKLSRQAVHPGGTDPFTTDNTYIAYGSQGIEASGTDGLAAIRLDHHVELWDQDWRLVLPPTFHLLTVGSGAIVVCVVAGELVPANEGERNAIILTQGGAKDA